MALPPAAVPGFVKAAPSLFTLTHPCGGGITSSSLALNLTKKKRMSYRIPVTACAAKIETDRPLAGFDPSIWGDLFLSYASDIVVVPSKMETEDGKSHENLKEKVRKMIVLATDNPLQHLDFIDAVQRLGVFYHFDKEVDGFMQKLHESGVHYFSNDDRGLYFTSLLFRLLRQYGYKISSDVFNKFKDDRGNFKESLLSDVQGMLSLYEATKLGVHGESILDQALDFTTTHLASSMESNSRLSFSAQVQIEHALNQSIRRNMPRNEAKRFISVYEEDPSHDKDLLTFAKLDFNILQKMHQKELGEIQRWYNSLDLPKILPFARNRVVESYFFSLIVYFEPQYSLGREMITKVIAVLSIVDDIYDSYGKFEELGPFTEAIEKWDIKATIQLPEYMKYCYQVMLDFFKDMEKRMVLEEKAYSIPYAIEQVKNLARAYFKEATWLNQNYVPKVKEYMGNGLPTSGYPMLTTTSLVGMGDFATKEVFEWMANVPKILKATSIIARVQNDVVSHEFEQKRGHVASAVECYMEQYGIGRQEAVKECYKLIEDAWKDINEECLHPICVPMPILMRQVNLARLMDITYKCGDGYTFPEVSIKEIITSVLIDPVFL